jgi:hypothetical protein
MHNLLIIKIIHNIQIYFMDSNYPLSFPFRQPLENLMARDPIDELLPDQILPLIALL